MPHEVVHEITRTIRGMKLMFKLKAPVAADVSEICEKIDKLYAWAEKDPGQFGLFDEDPTGGEPNDDPPE